MAKIKHHYKFINVTNYNDKREIQCRFNFDLDKKTLDELCIIANMSSTLLGIAENKKLEKEVRYTFNTVYVGIASFKENDIYDVDSAKRIALAKAKRQAYRQYERIMDKISHRLNAISAHTLYEEQKGHYEDCFATLEIFNELHIQDLNNDFATVTPTLSEGLIGVTNRGEWFKIWKGEHDHLMIYESGCSQTCKSLNDLSSEIEIVGLVKAQDTFKTAKRLFKMQIDGSINSNDVWLKYSLNYYDARFFNPNT